MLTHLKEHIIEVLGKSTSATLATYGPAGLQISVCPYLNQELQVLVRLPSQSEHLVNLETDAEVVMAEDGWRLYGTANIADPGCVPSVWQPAQIVGQAVLTVQPNRVEFLEPDGASVYETIDVD